MMLNIQKYCLIFANIVFDVIILVHKTILSCRLLGIWQDDLRQHSYINFVPFSSVTRLFLVCRSFRSRLFFVSGTFHTRLCLDCRSFRNRSPPLVSGIVRYFSHKTRKYLIIAHIGQKWKIKWQLCNNLFWAK